MTVSKKYTVQSNLEATQINKLDDNSLKVEYNLKQFY